MPVEVMITHNPMGTLAKKPTYLCDMEEKWKRWTGIDDPDIPEAIKDISGDLYTEIRKFEVLVCREIEERNLPETFKEFFKSKVNDTWRDIISHQKIGLDKFCIVVRRYTKEEQKDAKEKL